MRVSRNNNNRHGAVFVLRNFFAVNNHAEYTALD
jgi:hypothetical protein